MTQIWNLCRYLTNVQAPSFISHLNPYKTASAKHFLQVAYHVCNLRLPPVSLQSLSLDQLAASKILIAIAFKSAMIDLICVLLI